MKSILIIGLGRFGRHMAQKLIEEGNDVLGIDRSEERADKATDILHNIQIGDATDEHFMDTLGINNFDICVVAIGDNFQASLEITVILKDWVQNLFLPVRIVKFTKSCCSVTVPIMWYMLSVIWQKNLP